MVTGRRRLAGVVAEISDVHTAGASAGSKPLLVLLLHSSSSRAVRVVRLS